MSISKEEQYIRNKKKNRSDCRHVKVTFYVLCKSCKKIQLK